MSIIDYRQNVIEKIKAAMPVLKDVQPHPGKFTIEDIDRLCMKAPSAYVALLAAPGKERVPTGQVLMDVDVAVFIATRHGGGPKTEGNADVQGWRYAEYLASLALWNYFDARGYPASNVEIENLWSRDEDKKGTCIMAVAWCTQILIGEDLSAQMLGIKAGKQPVFPRDMNINANFHLPTTG